MSAQDVSARLQASRRNLLDTSRRNRLIHYRPSKASGLEIFGEDPTETYRLLVTEARALTFGAKDSDKSVPTVNQMALYEMRAEAEKELNEFLDGPPPSPNQTDLILNTQEDAAKLEIKLLKILRDARTVMEESGVNTLFLAVGMLRWQEVSGEVRQSPLVLVPVQLEPRKNGSYALRYDGSEIGFNLSLAAAMKGEFNVEQPPPPDPESLVLNNYFDAIREAIGRKSGWSVESDEIALGFFSYAKYLLYADLDEDGWPEDSKPADHELLASLLSTGFEDHDKGYPSTGSLDAYRSVEDIHDVIGADSSQTLAVMEASTGRSMVIQGPPGTGKSQTITNLMADALANGKRVLFVAEKMAALDVVARRMTECGLGDACLQLHSQKARKTEFFAELRRVLEIAEPGRVRAEDELQRLERARLELNAYSEAINADIGHRDISARDAMGRVIQLGDETGERLRVNLPVFSEWSEPKFQGSLPLVEALQSRFRSLGSPRDNPFFGSTMTVLIAMDVPGLLQSAGKAETNLLEVQRAAEQLAAELKLPAPVTLADVAMVASAADLVASAPVHRNVPVGDPAWHEQAGEIRELLAALRKDQELHRQFDSLLRPEAWTADVSTARSGIALHVAKWYRFLISAYRSACRRMDELAANPGADARNKLEWAEAIIAEQNGVRTINEKSELGRRLFGDYWQDRRTDVDQASRLFEWVLTVHQAISVGTVPSAFLHFFEVEGPVPDLSARAENLRARAQAVVSEFKSVASGFQFASPPSKLFESFASGQSLLASWKDGQTFLEQIVSFNKLAVELKLAGLDGLTMFVLDTPGAGERALEIYQRSWYDLLIREAFATSLPLQAFDRVRHEERIAEFRALDDKLLQINRTQIRLKHYAGVPSDQAGGMAGWLLQQTNRKRNLATIRQAMEKAGAGVQAIKPVFMMSPLSVAMYLPQAGRMFDLVIFDEASQVKPEDAFGAVLRGTQIVVVGDSKQMPPTSFFDKITGGEDDLEQEDAELNVANDMESILALMDSRIAPQSPRRRDLRWHYRSRHHSLIEPSNALFYQHRLFLFPNPEPPSDRLGLQVHRVPSAYDRGASRTNREEAKAVALAALEHVRNRKNESLMIVAFSQAQQQAIQDELDLLVRREPAFIEYAKRFPLERLDVKNLENVQGDERDAVFISIGYGRDSSGFLSMSFGPLNAEGGERRLNVLITRARQRCEVFTNLSSDDIKVEAGSKEGLKALKEFLHYAESGQLDVASLTGAEPMSPFEEAVLAALQAKGYEVEPQVGCAGFFIDLGVRDPDQVGRFVLGIECDGAQYHNSRTARDRDKLRQAVLEDRGWTIFRIWSTDWFSNPKQVMARLEAAIAQAKEGKRESTEPVHADDGLTIEQVSTSSTVPYEFADPQLSGMPTLPDLSRAIIDVLHIEGPMHVDELTKRLREAAQLPRTTEAFRESIRQALSGIADLDRQGEFIRLGATPIVVRDRTHATLARKIDLISDWEIEEAVRGVVAESFGIGDSEAGDLALGRLGFGRTTAQMQSRLAALTQSMIDRKVIDRDNGLLKIKA